MSRRRGRSTVGLIPRVLTTLVIVAVLDIVTGCAAGPARDASPVAEKGQQETGQLPGPIAGVGPCASLTMNAEAGANAVTGDHLSSRSLPCLAPGPEIDVARLGGRPTVINLWASWCGPCREETPLLQAVHDRYADDVNFVGVDTRDEPGSAATFVENLGVTYPQLSDPDAGFLGDLRSPGLPVTVVLRADGSLVERHIGPITTESQLIDLIKAASTPAQR